MTMNLAAHFRRCGPPMMLAVILLFSFTAAQACVHHSSARYAFVKKHPCPSTGKTKGACPGWIVDHVKALCVGGHDSPSNLQWQTVADAKAKDKWECKK